MRETLIKYDFEVGPSSDIQARLGRITPLVESNIEYSAMLTRYLEFFKSRGHKLDPQLGYKPKPTRRHFQTNLPYETAPDQNAGHIHKAELMIWIAIYEDYLVTSSSMALQDAELFNDENANPLILLLNRLNEKYCRLGMQFGMMPDTQHSGGTLLFQLVWKNVLTKQHLDEYYSVLKSGFREYGDNFDIFASVLLKFQLDEEHVVFPQYVVR